MQRTRLWDLPTRLFHWLLVAAIGAAWTTGELGGSWLIWHGRIGLCIAGLIVFRLVWGFVGSTYARFATFVRGPASIAGYLRGHWHGIGHNPLGALSVLALLLLVGAQVATGLFAADDEIGFAGYLNALVSSRASHLLSEAHEAIFSILLGFVALHVAAILFYVHVKKDNLVKPMLTGWKETDTAAPATGGGPLAFVLALAIALAAIYLLSGALIAPPTAAVAAPPSW